MIERGERVALVGVNGAGKSTLIKLLAGAEPVTRGDLKLGHNVETSYFAQDQYKELDTDARLLDDLSSVANGKTMTELRSLLGCFLFSDEEVFKQIGVLSGGERNRYALARMLLNPSNFLLLDEPTNHLDLRAKDVLLESLEKFTGTIVFVSHDRYFIDKLATRVFEIEAGEVRVYPGNYEDYLWRKAQPAIVAGPAGEIQPPPGPTLDDVPRDNTDASGRKRLNPQKLKQLEERAGTLEAEAARLESQIAELEASLQDFVNVGDTGKQMETLEQKRARLETVLGDWEETSNQIEENR
jgi:ATP-binding cassette subfamily F protein 3